MNRPEATVVAAGTGVATVSVRAAAACPRCASGRGCGAGLLQKGRTRVMQVRVADGLDLKAGDQVRLDLPPDGLLRAAWLAYGLPLSTMVFAVAVATVFVDPANDSAFVASGVLGLVAGVLVGRTRLAADRCMRRLTPVVCERILNRGYEPGVASPGPRVSGT